MPDLTEVPVEDLLAEVQRRMLCALKPQKRVILIGKQQEVHPKQLSDMLMSLVHDRVDTHKLIATCMVASE
jgi:hypothetical protein